MVFWRWLIMRSNFVSANFLFIFCLLNWAEYYFAFCSFCMVLWSAHLLIDIDRFRTVIIGRCFDACKRWRIQFSNGDMRYLLYWWEVIHLLNHLVSLISGFINCQTTTRNVLKFWLVCVLFFLFEKWLESNNVP